MARKRERKSDGRRNKTPSTQKYREPIRAVRVDASSMGLIVKDRRNHHVQGFLSSVCKQFGVDVSKPVNGKVILSAPRDRLQRVLEKIHNADIPYDMGS